MLSEVFNDSFAQKDNFLSRIDARVKMIFVFAGIITILFSRLAHVPAIVILLSLIFLLNIGIPFKIILLRMLFPLGMAVVILVLHLAAYKGGEGFFTGLLIMAKVAGCVSLVIFLSMTTPFNDVLNAFLWFKVPKTWIEIAAITYRYVFVLVEDAITIKHAQNVRLGYSNLSRSLQSLAELTASVFIRAYDQSLSTCEAMNMRGYTGVVKVYFDKKLRFKDVLYLVLFSLIIFLLIALNSYLR